MIKSTVLRFVTLYKVRVAVCSLVCSTWGMTQYRNVCTRWGPRSSMPTSSMSAAFYGRDNALVSGRMPRLQEGRQDQRGDASSRLPPHLRRPPPFRDVLRQAAGVTAHAVLTGPKDLDAPLRTDAPDRNGRHQWRDRPQSGRRSPSSTQSRPLAAPRPTLPGGRDTTTLTFIALFFDGMPYDEIRQHMQMFVYEMTKDDGRPWRTIPCFRPCKPPGFPPLERQAVCLQRAPTTLSNSGHRRHHPLFPMFRKERMMTYMT